jgi:hypothetical protein
MLVNYFVRNMLSQNCITSCKISTQYLLYYKVKKNALHKIEMNFNADARNLSVLGKILRFQAQDE